MSEYLSQIPFSEVESIFAENPEPRCPCVLLLDISGSMKGNPIAELSSGINSFKNELMSDNMAVKRVEIAIITFGNSVELATNFKTADEFEPPELVANGLTPMGEAIEKAVDIIKERKELYKKNGISYYRPWIFLITDGEPNDDWAKAIKLVEQGEDKKSFCFFAVGVNNANFEVLKEISVRDPLKLQGLKFQELFNWLSSSLSSVSRSRLTDKINLQNPSGWAVID